MAQPDRRKVKEFAIYQFREVIYNVSVIATLWDRTFEYHSLEDAKRKVIELLDEGAVLGEIRLVQNVIMKSTIKV